MLVTFYPSVVILEGGGYMRIDIEYPFRYASSGDSLFRDTSLIEPLHSFTNISPTAIASAFDSKFAPGDKLSHWLCSTLRQGLYYIIGSSLPRCSSLWTLVRVFLVVVWKRTSMAQSKSFAKVGTGSRATGIIYLSLLDALFK